jgi:deoxyribodipyrimidine photo-lyase
MAVEPERVLQLNEAPERPDRDYVLYWAQMNRRVESNHGLLYARELANRHHLPMLFYEGLTCSYEYANDRLHTFILQGVPVKAERLERLGIGYVFYLRKTRRDPNDVLYRLASRAAAVVTDDYPTFIARQHNASVPRKVDVAYYVVDSSCVVPMSVMPGRQYADYTIRPKINRLLPKYLHPAGQPHVAHRFTGNKSPFHTPVREEEIPALVASCEIDFGVRPSLTFTGGRAAAEKLLHHFLENNLARFAEARNEPS